MADDDFSDRHAADVPIAIASNVVTNFADSVDDAFDEKKPPVSEYQIRQIDTGRGGQILDCKVQTDSETGLPRVEMIFSINPLQLDGGRQLLQTDSPDNIMTITSSDFACPSDLQTTNPPDTLFLPIITPISPTDGCSPFREDPHADVTEVRQATRSQPSSTDTVVATNSNESISGRSDHEVEEDWMRWKRSLKDRIELQRLILNVTRVLDWTNDRDPFVIVIIITALFLLLRYVNASILTSVALVGCCLHVVELVRLLPGIENYVNNFVELSDDEELQLESTYIRMSAANRRLQQLRDEIVTLRNDRPATFMLVSVSGFFLMANLGQLLDGFLLLYIAVLVGTLTPGLLKHDIINQFSRPRLSNLRQAR
jgi:hypothetical protein